MKVLSAAPTMLVLYYRKDAEIFDLGQLGWGKWMPKLRALNRPGF